MTEPARIQDHEEVDATDVSIRDWDQGSGIFIHVVRNDTHDHYLVVNLEALLERIAEKHTPLLIEALDHLVRTGLIKKQLNLVPGQDTGSVSFTLPVTAYTGPLNKGDET